MRAFVAMLDIFDMFFFFSRLEASACFSDITPSTVTAGILMDNVCLELAGWPERRPELTEIVLP